MRIYLIE